MRSFVDELPLIGPASPEGIRGALALVFRGLPEREGAERLESLCEGIEAGTVSPEGVIEARRQGRLVGAAFWQGQVGRTAMLWPPRRVPDEPAQTAQRLLEACLAMLAARQVELVHAMVEPGSRPDSQLLQDAGFAHLADLLYLVSVDGDFPQSEPSGALEYEAYSPDEHDRLKRLVEATYEQTLDCPALDGLRDMEDVLRGYRAMGVFSPDRWLIARHGGRDVGCLLLADHPEHGNFELVYMGLVPSARGNAWGAELARHAQWLTRQAGRPRLVLAVDALNHPAIHAYAVLGFRGWDQRSIFMKTLPGGRRR